MANEISLTADEIDDVLYLARANESEELEEYLKELCARHSASAKQILEVCMDPETGNTALHFTAANGLSGKTKPPSQD